MVWVTMGVVSTVSFAAVKAAAASAGDNPMTPGTVTTTRALFTTV